MIHELDKLYAVSDLHLGGKPGRQAFREGKALAWLIDHATNDPAARVGLLLNGDIVDFLAAGPGAPEFNLAPGSFLRGVAADSAFADVFMALRQFVHQPRRLLVLQLGNHDIELALPSARAELLQMFGAEGDPNVASRVVFDTSGNGWTCRVAGRVVLAVHGNASDPWNTVDHVGLEKVVRALEANRPYDKLPETNAGTMLVIHAMNAIKESYPFVDLLKPEGAPLLAVLDATNARQSRAGLLRALKRRVRQGSPGELLGSAEVRHEELPAAGPARELLAFLDGVEVPPPEAGAAIRRAVKHFNAGETPRSLLRLEELDEQLGLAVDFARVKLQRFEAGIERVRGVPEERELRKALRDWLAEDTTFDFRALSSMDRRILSAASPGVQVLLAGHTHLPREHFDGSRTYLNTGTWMRVLSLRGSRFLQTDDDFASFMQAVKAGTLDALDALDLDPRVRPVAVVDEAAARLCSVKDAPGGKYGLTPVAELDS